MSLKITAPSFFISAGEYSGDLLGAELAAALLQVLPEWDAFGIVGPAMAQAGVKPVASIAELSVMGVTEVLSKLGALRMLEARLLEQIDRVQPRFALLIDNPGFHIRLAEQLRLRGIKVFQYVAPKIWAWGENRAPKIRNSFDAILGILPFEKAFFEERGIPYYYVGNPLKDRIEKVIVSKEHIGLPKDKPVVACLPGSRLSELTLNLPTLIEAKALVSRSLPEAIFVVPVAPNLGFETIARLLGQPEGELVPAAKGILGGKGVYLQGLHFVYGMSLELMAASDAAIVASGTATLECALLGTPMVVVYTMSALSYAVAKKVVHLPYVSLVNLVAQKKLVSEYIQEFSMEEIAEEVIDLLRPTSKRSAMVDAFREMREELQGSSALIAAETVKKLLDTSSKAFMNDGV